MNLPLEFLAALSLLSQQVTENVLGPLLSGPIMRLAAIGVSIGLAFGAAEMGVAGLEGMTPTQVLVLGAFAGLGSNVVHGLLVRFAPGAVGAPVINILRSLADRASASQPPAPPAPPAPPVR